MIFSHFIFSTYRLGANFFVPIVQKMAKVSNLSNFPLSCIYIFCAMALFMSTSFLYDSSILDIYLSTFVYLLHASILLFLTHHISAISNSINQQIEEGAEVIDIQTTDWFSLTWYYYLTVFSLCITFPVQIGALIVWPSVVLFATVLGTFFNVLALYQAAITNPRKPSRIKKFVSWLKKQFSPISKPQPSPIPV